MKKNWLKVVLTQYMIGLNLDYITTNVWVVVNASALKGTNIHAVVDWLVKQSKKAWLNNIDI